MSVKSARTSLLTPVECGRIGSCVCSDVPADDEEYQAKAGEDETRIAFSACGEAASRGDLGCGLVVPVTALP